MKKSNKTTFLYIISSVSLLLVLLFGGCYGVYISVGLSFVRSGVSNITEGASNVSFGGEVNFQTSMLGVIVLSTALIFIAILDFISLIKQITFFKQFGVIKDSSIVNSIEKKSKGKGKIIFFAVLIDIISFAAGILGILINIRSFPDSNMVWIIYVVDGLISVLSVMSIVLLIIKLKKLKEEKKNKEKNTKNINEKLTISQNNESINIQKDNKETQIEDNLNINEEKINLNDIEYKLLKLRQLKSSRILTNDEYEILRKRVISNSNNIEFNIEEK